MSPWDISNPRYQSIGTAIEGLTNIPLGRVVKKINNVKQALNEDHEMWQRIAMMLGWNTWDVGVRDSEILKIKGENKTLNKSNSGWGSKDKKSSKSKKGWGSKNK